MNTKQQFINTLENTDVHDHLCLIYESKEEQFKALIPFIRKGLENGEQCIYIADDNTVSSVIKTLEENGIDVDSQIRDEALVIANKKESYLKKGYFDPDWMIDFLKDTTYKAKDKGFNSLRVTGEMTWALGDNIGNDRLLENESKLNDFFPDHDCLAICQYNYKRFSPEVIKGVIYTHPKVIYRENVINNMYYVPPEKLSSNNFENESQLLLNNLLLKDWYESELINLLPTAVYVCAGDGEILRFNKKAAELWGRKPKIGDKDDRFCGSFKLYRPDGTPLPHNKTPMAEVLKKGVSFKNEEVIIERPDGSRITVSVNIAPMKNSSGVVTKAVNVFQDITEIKELERRKDDFVIAASHELKTPITSTKIFMQALIKEFENRKEEKILQYCSHIINQLNRQTKLVADLLDLSKIADGKLVLNVSRFDLHELVEEIIMELKSIYPSYEIEYENGKNLMIKADRDRLGQVFYNLLSNAIKYSKEKDKVIINIKKKDGGVTVEVQDFGIGIAKKHHSMIFDRFYRVPGALEKTYPGMGMGLYISSQIIEGLNGSMGVKSKKGIGSTFYFTLPIE